MEITKGDNKSFQFKRKNEHGEAITTIPSEVYITFKNNSYNEKYLFQKRLSDGSVIYDEDNKTYTFEIIPEDTDNLDYGTYYFDIELILDGKKKTIYKGELEVTFQYTFPSNEV